MMKKRRISAAVIAAALCAVGFSVHGSASEILLVPVESGIMLSDRIGRVYIHVQNQDELHVIVDKTEPEGVFRYYDAEIVGTESQSETIYQMDLSRCEYLVDTGNYASQYTISIFSSADPEAFYTQNFVVQDPDFEKISGSEYHFYVTLQEGSSSGFQVQSSQETVEEGVLICEQVIELQYQKNALGDVDGDGMIAISDATEVLTYYARTAAALEAEIDFDIADIDKNGIIEITDATYILTYYAQTAVGMNPSWDDLIS